MKVIEFPKPKGPMLEFGDYVTFVDRDKHEYLGVVISGSPTIWSKIYMCLLIMTMGRRK